MCDKYTTGTQTFSNPAELLKFLARADPLIREKDMRRMRRKRRRRGDGESDLDPIAEEDEYDDED